jgi:hypothetical protein
MLFNLGIASQARKTLAGPLLAIGLLAASQSAQTAGNVHFGSFALGTFRNLQERAFRPFALEAPEETLNTLDVGLNLGWPDSGGHDWSTPLQLEHDLAGDSWQFFLQGSGFEDDVPSSGPTRSGFTDLTAVAIYPVAGKKNVWQLLAGGSVTAPTHGEVGSRSAIEGGRLVLKNKLTERWGTVLIGAEGYVNTVPSGVSQRASFIHGELHYTIRNDEEEVFLALERSVRAGADSASNAILAYAFPLPKLIGKLTGGIFALGRGLASPANTSIEMDLEWKF